MLFIKFDYKLKKFLFLRKLLVIHRTFLFYLTFSFIIIIFRIGVFPVVKPNRIVNSLFDQ